MQSSSTPPRTRRETREAAGGCRVAFPRASLRVYGHSFRNVVEQRRESLLLERASVVQVWMHLTRVIFLLGAGATRGLAREALRRTIPECFRSGAAGSHQSDSAPLTKQKESGRPSIPDGLAAAPNRQVARTPLSRRPRLQELAARATRHATSVNCRRSRGRPVNFQ